VSNPRTSSPREAPAQAGLPPGGTTAATREVVLTPRSRYAGVASALSPRRISGIYILIALIIFFSLATSTFWSVTTLRTIATEQAVTAIVAIGLTVALAAGVFDLSIGGVLGLANIIVAKLMVSSGVSPMVAIIVTVLICGLIGVVNGLLVTKARIDPFIATLGTSSILTAAIFVVSSNQNILGVPNSFLSIANNGPLGIPLPVFYVVGLGLIVWYVLACTPTGRRLYATGGGRDVARLAGVPTTKYIMLSFVCSAAIAGAAGVLVVSTIGTGSTEVGPSYLLPAFAAGFLGATQFRPGRFNVPGTVLAVYLLATGVQGLVLMGASTWVPDLFNGLALIIAVGLSGLQRRARVKASSADTAAPASGAGGAAQPSASAQAPVIAAHTPIVAHPQIQESK
jgi:ribose transport system permease protein